MRNYQTFDSHYQELVQDIYPNPPDEGHTSAAQEIVDKWIKRLAIRVIYVLDAGCGEAFMQPSFEALGCFYTGVCLGEEDYKHAIAQGRHVYNYDYTFLPDNWNRRFDLVFARHSLEHSPFPLLTLMEWHRVAKYWLCVVVPNPQGYSYIGRNHYSVMPIQQIRWTLRRAGWKVTEEETTEKEFRFLCRKRVRLGCEGWISNLTAEFYDKEVKE
jgi:Methyltransferase domain